jgi:phosphoribosylaminoimidazolecarboxamide formyltransferase / IMP cyclohydrolase
VAEMKFKNALVSCSDKTGLTEFLNPLVKKGLRIVSTGGTAKHLRAAGFKVVEVSEQTGFPEVMDGRVKTLHPKIHMALLARAGEAEDMAILKEYGVDLFDLVIGNLYPFESEPGIENIDIGGPSFLRSSAKSFDRIAVICDPNDYKWVSEKDELTLNDRQKLASKIFAHTAAYDSMIAKYFAGTERIQFNDLSLGGRMVQPLRYGENPAQQALWFRTGGEANGLHRAQILQGKELSYNNLLDLEAAVATLREFKDDKACIAVKHNSPCGAAVAKTGVEAARKAIAADSQSVFGGIVALNFSVDDEVATDLSKIFLECVVAPDFTPAAQAVFAKKKNVRLLSWPEFQKTGDPVKFRTVSGGFLVQTADVVEAEWNNEWKLEGAATKLTPQLKSDLLFALKISAHLKSNAIAIASHGQTVGLGMGQVNRVDAVEQAITRMQRFHPNVENAVLASDAFFPFADSIDKIAESGIRYIIQPGGSVKDDEVKARARERDIVMVLTGQRHFTH